MTAKKSKIEKLLNPEPTIRDRLCKKFITTPPTPLAAEWDEWEEIEVAQRKNHPIAYFILHDCYYSLSSMKRRYIKDSIWWLRYRLQKKHKYHLIDTKLEPGYYDTDSILLHGCFSAFED